VEGQHQFWACENDIFVFHFYLSVLVSHPQSVFCDTLQLTVAAAMTEVGAAVITVMARASPASSSTITEERLTSLISHELHIRHVSVLAV
jgi:hypothetical protein